jgi:hypothetical protein
MDMFYTVLKICSNFYLSWFSGRIGKKKGRIGKKKRSYPSGTAILILCKAYVAMYQKERWAGGMAEEWAGEEKTPYRYF